MERIRRIWVIGAGAVGSVLAAVLQSQRRARVTLVGSSIHWETLQGHGLLFETHDGESRRLALPTLRCGEVPRLGAQDLVLLTAKLPAMEGIASWLRRILAPETPVVALQNGLGVAAWIAPLLGRSAAPSTPGTALGVDRALVVFGAHCRIPGRVTYYPGRLRLARTSATEALAALLAGSPIRCEFPSDFREAEWRKLAINCLANPLAGLLDLDNEQLGQALLDPAKQLILDELLRVARAEGVELKIRVADFNRYIHGPNIPSLRVDLLRGQPTEIDFLNGVVVRLGLHHGIATPVNALVVALTHALEARPCSTPAASDPSSK